MKISDPRALPCIVLSTVCAVVGTIHFIFSEGIADFVLVALILICFVPWLGHIFEGFGGKDWGTRFRDPTEPTRGSRVGPPVPDSESEDITPTPVAVSGAPAAEDIASATVDSRTSGNPPFSHLTWEEQKVLATLWKYQKIYFPDPTKGQWTFIIGQGSPEYQNYARGVLGLGKYDLVSIANNGHCVLSQAGIDYCIRNNASIGGSTYDNFSN